MADLPAEASFRILVVCTANICRSVMAEQFLRRHIEERALDGVGVASCGVLFDGEPASDTVTAVLAERGLDASDHASRRFTPEMVTDADLVVTMERGQARQIALAVDGVSARVHTLASLVGWLAETEDLAGSPGSRLDQFAASRRSTDLLGSGDDEVADPHGRSKRVHRKTADRLDALAVGLLGGLYGSPPTG